MSVADRKEQIQESSGRIGARVACGLPAAGEATCSGRQLAADGDNDDDNNNNKTLIAVIYSDQT